MKTIAVFYFNNSLISVSRVDGRHTPSQLKLDLEYSKKPDFKWDKCITKLRGKIEVVLNDKQEA